jgi:cell envelope opacity-associated protein A
MSVILSVYLSVWVEAMTQFIFIHHSHPDGQSAEIASSNCTSPIIESLPDEMEEMLCCFNLNYDHFASDYDLAVQSIADKFAKKKKLLLTANKIANTPIAATNTTTTTTTSTSASVNNSQMRHVQQQQQQNSDNTSSVKSTTTTTARGYRVKRSYY